MLELTAIQKSFGSYAVLSIDQLDLSPGIHWLKGANGAGKSTLLRVIAGMLPFKGDIRINGRTSLRKQPVEYRLAVNYAEAEPVYPSFLTGDELIGFLSAIKKGRPELIQIIKGKLGMDSYTANPCGSYSSGMLKKLSLLAAFMGEPVWILLDEPLTTLDTASQHALSELIMQTREQRNISFLITSHQDIEHEAIHFDRIFTLRDKQLHETLRSR